MTTLLSARGLSLTYPGSSAPALDGVDLDVAVGESVAVTGASGSGKTTLLHCLAGILSPTAGEVTVATRQGAVALGALDDAGRSRLRREELGFVFQQGLLLDELTALENVAVARMLVGVSRAQAEAEAAQQLAHLGLAGLERRRLGELSGGQAQRVAIARAHVTGARLVFADEPTGALDSATSADVLDVLLASVATGRTLVVVTHDPEVAARCARTVHLRDGRVVADTADVTR
ncbi:putative ABC transport system ATP-binding protein [Isoptericola jiangsuensis]|uniref:Putative ABC transport system ATP-binding protein n=1 Tax=Isoptericola jiangsuensis TaxID=548579 RepID=A0A2A9ET75_9MICO|nr:ABC transporter ATP-binding protein [Isoptericola jiangsuensis]PFG41953.1 putative ABC transport system ATP-binding protein [Isoptericola jiangsuensis]